MNISKEEIIESISKMSVMDIVDLTQSIKKKFKIEESMIVNSNTENKDSSNKDNKIKKEFDVILKSYGSNKISVIKTIRSILNLGLKESKNFVENSPSIIKSKISELEAKDIKKKNGGQWGFNRN